jgi:hypothetical protein
MARYKWPPERLDRCVCNCRDVRTARSRGLRPAIFDMTVRQDRENTRDNQ